MKVLHISMEDQNGAGLCAYRLHKSLQDKGIESKMLTLRKKSNDSSVYKIKSPILFFTRIINKVIRIFGLKITDYNKILYQNIRYNSTYTLPITPLDITSHPLVREADIIHLHWVNNFFNQPLFFKKITKPIVWTIHDENFFYGTSHFHDSILKDDPLEQKYYKIKHEMVTNAPKLGIVLLSNYFLNTFGRDKMLTNKKIKVINNSVDCNKFIPINKYEAREKNGIDKNKIILLFIASDIMLPHKGLNILIEAVKQLNRKDIQILAIGKNTTFTPNPLVITTGQIKDQNKMSELISAADFFVMPSLQEAFAQSPIEAMACGKPAIVFPVSGTQELINNSNGILCSDFTINALINGLQKAFSINYDSKIIREDVKKRFSPDYISDQYIAFYKEIIK